MEALGQLTGGVAHDFNNLLTVILGSVELCAGGSPTRAAGALCSSDREAARAWRRADRASCWPSRRRQPLKPGVVDLRQADLSCADADGVAWPRPVEARHRPRDELSACRGRRRRSSRLALLNLAVNARDAMPDGGRL